MFTITCFADVLFVAKTFGVAALDHVLSSGTMNFEANQTIISCRKWAGGTAIEVDSFNDGNTSYDITAYFTAEKLGGDYYTNVHDVTIVRHGAGAYKMSAKDAMDSKELTPDQLRYIIAEASARNDARVVLGL